MGLEDLRKKQNNKLQDDYDEYQEFLRFKEMKRQQEHQQSTYQQNPLSSQYNQFNHQQNDVEQPVQQPFIGNTVGKNNLTLSQTTKGWLIFFALICVIYAIMHSGILFQSKSQNDLSTSDIGVNDVNAMVSSENVAVENGDSSIINSQIDVRNDDQLTVSDAGARAAFDDVKINGTTLSVGDKTIDESGAIVCLPYVKRSDKYPTGFVSVDLPAGHEVILSYFEYYNDGDNSLNVNPGAIVCYADGNQVSTPESYITLHSDGVNQVNRATLLPGTKVMSVHAFEVSKGWSELKFFTSDQCVWRLTQEDVKTHISSVDSVFPTVAYDYTPIGSKVYSGDYDLFFEGMAYYEYDLLVMGRQKYAVCKFKITNLKDTSLSTNLLGYHMTAYIDGSYTENYDYLMDDKIDNYINVFKVDSIAPGMSANVYIAFDVTKKPNSVLLRYDDGFIVDGNMCFMCGRVE